MSTAALLAVLYRTSQKKDAWFHPNRRFLVPEIACMASSSATSRLLLMWIRLAHVECPIKGCSTVELSNRVVSNRPIQKCDCQNRGLQGTSLNRSTAGCSPSRSRPAALALAQRKRC